MENNQNIEEEIDLLDLIKVLWKNKYLIGIIAGVFLVLSVIVSLMQTPVYKSEMRFVAEGQKQSSMGSIGGLSIASLAGISTGGDSQNFMVILQSRTFREDLINDYKLYDYFIEKNEIDLKKLTKEQIPTIYDVANWLNGISFISLDEKSGVYSIGIELDDPEKATELANNYFTELEKYLKEKNISQSRRNREFIEKQLSLVEEKLKSHEEDLKEVEKQYGTVSILDEAKAVVSMVAEFKKSIMEAGVKLEIAKEFTGASNIEVKKLNKEIDTYQEQINLLKRGNEKHNLDLIPLNDIPDIKIKMERLQRELNATAEIYKMLLLQYETAKIEEIKDTTSINILDKAIVPKQRIKPNKKLNVIIGFVLGVFMGIFVAFAKEFVKNVEWEKIIED